MTTPFTEAEVTALRELAARQQRARVLRARVDAALAARPVDAAPSLTPQLDAHRAAVAAAKRTREAGRTLTPTQRLILAKDAEIQAKREARAARGRATFSALRSAARP